MEKCIYEGCDRPVDARGMCGTHYMQQRRAGLLPVGTRMAAPVEERFWRYVEKSPGCWTWTGGSMTKKGYGQIGLGGRGAKFILAHRLSYQIHCGEIPEGMVVMHLCDNPSCVNPEHLKTGTQSENIKHAVHSGRKSLPDLPHPQGIEHHKAKLDDDKVRWIRTCGKSIREMALELGVSKSTVERVKNGLRWTHVT